MAQKDDSIGILDVLKIVLITAGAIYLVSLVTWLAHWGVIAVAVGGVGYLAWQISAAFNEKPKQQLIRSESPFDARMKQLDAEDKALNKKLGL